MAAAPSAAAQGREERAKRPSGRLLLRMPAELHAELAQAAEREGVSLNAYITQSLAARVGWGDALPEESAADRRARTVLAVLVANAVVLALAAAAAIAILVLAWRS
jgi:hypothetical protein